MKIYKQCRLTINFRLIHGKRTVRQLFQHFDKVFAGDPCYGRMLFHIFYDDGCYAIKYFERFERQILWTRKIDFEWVRCIVFIQEFRRLQIVIDDRDRWIFTFLTNFAEHIVIQPFFILRIVSVAADFLFVGICVKLIDGGETVVSHF